MKYLIISCETSGIGPDIRNASKLNQKNYFQPLSWGLLVVDNDFNKIDELYVQIKYNAEYKPVIWDPSSQKVHNLNPSKLEKQGLNEIEAVEEIGNFIMEHFELNKITVIGYNTSTLGLPFFDDMFKRYNINLNFDYHVYDLNTIGLLFNAKTKAELFDLFNVTPSKRNSLYDARAIATCFSRIKKMWDTLL